METKKKLSRTDILREVIEIQNIAKVGIEKCTTGTNFQFEKIRFEKIESKLEKIRRVI